MYTAQKFCHFSPSQGSLVQAQYLPTLSMGQVQPHNTFSSIFFPHSPSFLHCHILFLGSHCFKSIIFGCQQRIIRGKEKNTTPSSTTLHNISGRVAERNVLLFPCACFLIVPYMSSPTETLTIAG